MTPELDSASIYTDFSGLAELRRQAQTDPDASLRQVAEQFEAIFMQMMLKSMREASFGDPLFQSNQSEFYQGMHDQQLSLHMAGKGGLGLADMLVQQLSQLRAANQAEQKSFRDYKPVAVSDHSAEEVKQAARQVVAEQTSQASPVSTSKPQLNAVTPDETPFAGPVDFIKRVWHMAQDAASELGTEPAVIVAQAALETGWGKAIQKRADGRSSYNLFNIKADTRWQQDKVSVSTLEYRDGVAHKERAEFRAYDSLQHSFDDYVRFIKNSPRYHQALQKAADPHAYIEELHKAGYATDPEYSNKIKGILERPQFDEIAGAIKVSQNETLS